MRHCSIVELTIDETYLVDNFRDAAGNSRNIKGPREKIRGLLFFL